jgi:hypothetical protein
MLTYSQLGTTHRGDPCKEYPGMWLVFAIGKEVASRDTFDDAWSCADVACKMAPPETVSICWKCSDDDPRMGQVWFTGFYQHGKFDAFGRYRND